MKKYLIPALALGLVMTSCQSDEPFAPVEGGEKQVTFTLNVPGELGTRAAAGANKSDKGGLSNNAGELSYTLVLDAKGDQRKFTKTGAGSVVFNPTVVLGREYTVTAYAHFGEAWDGATAIDITKHFNDETKDAYFKQENIKFQLNETSKQITLKRPFGKLRLLATDYTATGNELNTAVESVIIEYLDINASKFNPITGLFDDNGVYTNLTTPQTFGYYAAEDDGAMPIFADYIPANDQDNMVDFKVTVKYLNSTETYSRTFNDIPVRRNALTTLKGNFFTAGAEITVNVVDNFENIIPGEGNEKAVEQLIIAAAMGGSYTLPCDVTLSKPLKVQADMVLNLNGKTITTTWENEQDGRHHYAILNNANLVLEGEGAINARGIKNFGEMTVNGNVTIKNIDSNGGAAIWNEGKVTINNGTFISSEGAGADTYGAALNTRASGEAVVNGGTFEAYSQLTYAIVNEGKMTINDAAVKGKHGAVAGAESNDQTTINGGSFKLIGVSSQSDHCAYCVSNIRGGVFSRNEADTSNGDSVFYNSTIADGYKAIEKDGKWIVVAAPNDAASLATAVEKGGVIVLDENITLNETIVIPTGVTATLDLNGKTVNAPSSSAFVAKEGAELTIKNGKVVAYEAIVSAQGGKIIVESGEYTSTGTALDTPATYRYSLDCREGGELVVNGGTFKSNNGMINVGSTVTINGGKFENVVEKRMTRHFAYVSAPLTINDGEFYGMANSGAGGCFFCGAAATGLVTVNGGKFTSLLTTGSVNRIFEVYFGGSINVTGGLFNTNGGIASFVVANTDDATKGAYPYKAK